MKKFSYLKSGDVIGVCAPAARFDQQKFNKGIDVLKNLGFKVKVPEKIFEKKRYLAGVDLLRANIVNQLFLDPDVDGIICGRGGFGTMRILDYLDWDLIRENPKPFVGFSDATALLLSIIDKIGNPVIHGPNLTSFADAEQETIESFHSAIQGVFKKIEVKNGKTIKPGKCAGVLKGGNISTISHLLGTKYQPDFKNAVILLEDIGEPAYKIDRMLTQMKMAGMFNNIQGVIAGTFKNCENNYYLEEILSEIFEKYNVPVLSGLDCGHGRVNMSMGMGMDIEMNARMDTRTSSIHWI